MLTLRRIAFATLVVTALALGSAQVSGADNGLQSLTGEDFLVQDATLTLDCDPARVSTVTFSASGIAVGPYPGPFTVHGTVRIAPQTLPGPRPGTVAGPLLSLRETFSVTSPVGMVRGVKRLPQGLPFDSSQGSCQEVTDFAVGNVVGGQGTVVDIFSQPRYAALISSSGSHSVDWGDALFSLSELDLDGTCPIVSCHFRQAGFSEGFVSTRLAGGEDEDEDDDDESEDDEDESEDDEDESDDD